METEKNETEWKGMRASPSAINALIRCPRYFYYNYIKKIDTPDNIFVIKGNIIHKVMELFFGKYLSLIHI